MSAVFNFCELDLLYAFSLLWSSRIIFCKEIICYFLSKETDLTIFYVFLGIVFFYLSFDNQVEKFYSGFNLDCTARTYSAWKLSIVRNLKANHCILELSFTKIKASKKQEEVTSLC